MIKDGKSVCILSDSICKRIKINELNKYIKNKKAYKRCFDGADTKALLHYAIHTLKKNKPDIVILNIGSNNMRKDKPTSIADDIINIVSLCKSYGVKEIFVSGVTPRYGCQTKINELNSMLGIKQVESNYRFIKNENIMPTSHLWREKVHLNECGLTILVNNFINILNDDTYSA